MRTTTFIYGAFALAASVNARAVLKERTSSGPIACTCADGNAPSNFYTSQNGETFGICYDTDFPGGDLDNGTISDISSDQACEEVCSTTPGCVAATLHADSDFCYVKGTLTSPVSSPGEDSFCLINPPSSTTTTTSVSPATTTTTTTIVVPTTTTTTTTSASPTTTTTTTTKSTTTTTTTPAVTSTSTTTTKSSSSSTTTTTTTTTKPTTTTTTTKSTCTTPAKATTTSTTTTKSTTTTTTTKSTTTTKACSTTSAKPSPTKEWYGWY